MGVFARIMMGLAAEVPDNKTISTDATYCLVLFIGQSGSLQVRHRRLCKGGSIARLRAGATSAFCRRSYRAKAREKHRPDGNQILQLGAKNADERDVSQI